MLRRFPRHLKPPATTATGRENRVGQTTMTNSDDNRPGHDRRSFLRLVSAIGIVSAVVVPGELLAVEPQNGKPGPGIPPNPSAAPLPQSTVRLPTIPPDQVSAEQQPLFGKLRTGVQEHLQGFVTQKPDGALIGPFNALLHFPAYGTPAWDLFLALAGGSVLPKAVRETVILSTGARYGSLYELYSHEALAPKVGLSASKIRTLAAGERPSDLTDEEGIGYDVAACLAPRPPGAEHDVQRGRCCFQRAGRGRDRVSGRLLRLDRQLAQHFRRQSPRD